MNNNGNKTMKYIFSILATILFTTMANAQYYNNKTGELRYELPNPLNGGFNPLPYMYRDAGWYPAQMDNGGIWSNKVSSSWEIVDDVAIETADFEPIINIKDAKILLAERQYLGIWQYIFGADDTTFTNISRDDVLFKFAAKAEVDPSLYAMSYPFERSFDIFADWWIGVNGGRTFHPYPWGITNVNMSEFYGE